MLLYQIVRQSIGATDGGLRIPDDLSVIGFDNQHSVADSLFPGLATMALPHYDMGPGGCGILWTRSSSMGTGPPSMWLSPARWSSAVRLLPRPQCAKAGL
jgi:DNA-binding LacI/PurR family transcriptional regulator